MKILYFPKNSSNIFCDADFYATVQKFTLLDYVIYSATCKSSGYEMAWFVFNNVYFIIE